MSVHLADIVAMQSRGARIDTLSQVRRGGAGPADAMGLIIDGHPVMIPALSWSARESEYELVPENDRLRLEKNGHPIGLVRAVPRPVFYDGRTADGIPYSQIARLHGMDCLASTVFQECVRYENLKTRCRFCAIGASLDGGSTIRVKTPEQLAEVALAARNLDGVRHVTLTAGTTADPDVGALYLGRCAQAIKETAELPVEIQFEPLRDKALYRRLRDMGVDDVGIHIESFDPSVRRRITPGKALISMETYYEAFEVAVDVFGRNKVSTYVILGLGEDEELTIEGCRKTAAMGVYPVVVPLRPLLDSFLAGAGPVDPAYLNRMYRAVGKILRANGLNAECSTAGCVRCRACSLLQFVEQDASEPEAPAMKEGPPFPAEATVSVAASEEEIEEYRCIRREVFVEEQGAFHGSDIDGNDRDAIVIIARVDGRVAGGVRCFRHHGGIWFGGRLAVRSGYRGGLNLGGRLVQKAVETMVDRGDVRRFLATVQEQNVRFFERLGWIRLGKVFTMHGRKHQLMERRLRDDHN